MYFLNNFFFTFLFIYQKFSPDLTALSHFSESRHIDYWGVAAHCRTSKLRKNDGDDDDDDDDERT
jgi:hypothetical protein